MKLEKALKFYLAAWTMIFGSFTLISVAGLISGYPEALLIWILAILAEIELDLEEIEDG